MSATVTVSTSVILAPTQNTAGDYIVYFPNISTNGRLITVRDNDGYASTNHAVVLSTIDGAQFQTGVTTTQSQIYINQPFGFITLNSQTSGRYTILNTFAFPEGSAAAFVSKVTTNNLVTSTLQMIDIGTQSTNTFFTSTGFMYLNSNVMGQVSEEQLTSTVTGLGTAGYISTIILPPISPALYVATGFSSNQRQTSSKDPLGSIIYHTGSNVGPWTNATQGYSVGFSNGGNDVAMGGPFIVAVGDAYANQASPSYIQISVDGCNWNYGSAFLSSQQVRTRVSFANGLYHAIGSNGSNGGVSTIMLSRDAYTWNASVVTPATTAINPFQDGYARGITYGNGRWVAVGTQPLTIDYSILNSTDGSNWSPSGVVQALNNTPIWDVAFNGINRFLALCAQTTTLTGNILRSFDGVNWTNLPTSYSNTNFNNGVASGGYIAGNDTTWLVTSSNNSPSGQMLWRSADNGDTWSVIPTFSSGSLSRPYWDGAIWWIGFSNPVVPNGQSIFYSHDDGITWTSNFVGTNSFQGGFAQGFAARGAQSNFASALLSTVIALSSNQSISSLQTNVISTNSITAATMTVSSLFVQVEVISTSIETINTISTVTANNLSAGVAYLATAAINSNAVNFISAGTQTVSSLFVTLLGVSTINPLETVDINGVLNLRAGTVSQDSTTADEGSRLNTYIRFGEASTLTDYAYLRQIGGINEIHLALDLHDDFNDGSFSIRSVHSSGQVPDAISTLFTVDGRNRRVGILTSTPQVTLDVNGEIRSKISTFGYVALTSGSNGDYRGVLEFRNGTGVRQGYIGWASEPTTYINMATENGAVGYSVSSNFRVGGSLGIGLGTGVPAYPLDVNGNARIANGVIGSNTLAPVPGSISFSHISFVNTFGYSIIQTPLGRTSVNSATGQPVYFSIGDLVRMTLSNDSLGIGTLTPGAAYKLDVNGDIRCANIRTTGGTAFIAGMIMMWNGTTAPTGWNLCDGTNGTPDLRNRFVLGASSTIPFDTTGGAASISLGLNELPVHSHGINDPGHFHQMTLHVGNSGGNPNEAQFGGTNDYQDQTGTTDTKYTGITGTSNAGNGNAFSILNPYYALCYIMKLP